MGGRQACATLHRIAFSQGQDQMNTNPTAEQDEDEDVSYSF